MIQEDFEQHVVKLQNALLGFAKSLTHNEDEAKDLLQETSLKALSNKAMYDDSGSIKSWLYTIEEFYKLKYCSTVVYMVPRA